MDIESRRGTKRSRSNAAAAPPAKKARSTTRTIVRRSSTFAPEIKHFDTSFAFTVPGNADWTGTEVACTNYIQSDGTTVGAYTDSALIPSAVGTGYGNVQGSKYMLKSVNVRGEIVFGAVSDAADMYGMKSVRLVLVRDKMPGGSQAQGETIFPDMGTAPQCNYSYLSLASGVGGRFEILADKVFTHDNIVAGTDGASTNSLGFNGRSFKMSWSSKRGIPVNIKSSGATPATSQLSDCNIFLLAHASGTTPTVTLNGASRASFYD